MSGALVVIPARFASTRLPGKMLLSETGKPLVVHTAEAAAKAASVSRVLVAADDARIVEAVERAGFEAVMTDPEHQSGTERIAEAMQHVRGDHGVIVNVQGDEPEIDPAHIDRLVAVKDTSDAFAATLVSPFPDDAAEGPGSPLDPNCVKAVLAAPDAAGVRHALYFTRALAPFPRDGGGRLSTGSDHYLHLGVYAFSPESLARFAASPPSTLERTERLEQLRILEMGERIAVAEVAGAAPGIDTPDDYAAFVQRAAAR